MMLKRLPYSWTQQFIECPSDQLEWAAALFSASGGGSRRKVCLFTVVCTALCYTLGNDTSMKEQPFASDIRVTRSQEPSAIAGKSEVGKPWLETMLAGEGEK